MPDQYSEGGIALDAAGNPADMPRDMAGHLSDELCQIATLLLAMKEAAQTPDADHAGDRVLCRESRTVHLATMADRKVRAAIEMIEPYV